jgi:hypothetical protein
VANFAGQFPEPSSNTRIAADFWLQVCGAFQHEFKYSPIFNPLDKISLHVFKLHE